MLKLILSMHCKNQIIVKEVVRRKVTNINFKQTFQYRILDYFENKLKPDKDLHWESNEYQQKSPDLFVLNNLSLRSDNDSNANIKEMFQAIYKDIDNLQTITDKEIYLESLENIDVKCISIINKLKPIDILNLLNAMLKVIPNELVFTYSFDKCISILIKAAEQKLLTKDEIMQLLFLVSLKKEKGINYISYLEPYLPDINELPLFEKCVAAQALLNTLSTIQQNQLKAFEKTIERDFEQLLDDPNLFVPLCKIVLSTDTGNKITFKRISNSILEIDKPLNFSTMVNLLSLYAGALVLEATVTDKLVKGCIEVIKEDVVENKSSLKIEDVNVLLWSISCLGLTLTMEEKMILKSFVQNRIDDYLIRRNLGSLVTALLCLHMLRNWSTKLIKKCLKLGVFEQVMYGRYDWKCKSRMQLLFSQLCLEMKMIGIPRHLIQEVKIGYTPSENLILIESIGRNLVRKGFIDSCKIECPINALILPGITITKNKTTYHIDILDNLTCFRNTNIPHGLMNLKLRLLSRLRYRQILIKGNSFKGDPVQINEILEQRIVDMMTYGRALDWIKNDLQ